MKTSGMVRFAIALALVSASLLSGCVTVHERDDATVAAIARTIQNRKSDFARWKRELQKPKPSDRDLAGIQALQDSELDRLARVLSYEQSKAGKTATAAIPSPIAEATTATSTTTLNGGGE